MTTHRGRLSFSSAEEGLDAGAGSFSADAPAAAAAGKARRKFEQVKLCLYVLKHFIHCCLFHSIVAYYNTLQPYTYQLLHITTHCNHTLTNCCSGIRGRFRAAGCSSASSSYLRCPQQDPRPSQLEQCRLHQQQQHEKQRACCRRRWRRC